MKQYVQHSILTLVLVLATLLSVAQSGENVRYVECGSRHALSVPANDDYSFRWSMTWGNANRPVIISDTTNVTRDIRFDQCNTHYDVTVYPVLHEVGCLGEPVYMIINTVEHFSLQAMDDAFYTEVNVPVDCDVSRNDFESEGYPLIYISQLVSEPRHGTVTMNSNGVYTYTPNTGFVGIDTFFYDVRNDPPSGNPMFDNAMVIVVVEDKNTVANLYIEKTGPEKALFGGRIEYSILIRNNGPDIARNVVLRDSVPFGLLNPTYLYKGQPEMPWPGSLAIGDMKVNDTVFVSLIATVSPNSPKGIWNQAITWSEVDDPDILDNDSIWYTEIVPLFVTLPGQLMAPACRPIILPNVSDGNSPIIRYLWTMADGTPAIGLDNDTIATPTFTPDETTAGNSWSYVLQVTDSLGNVASDTLTLIVAELPVALIEGGDTLFRDRDEQLLIDGRNSIGDGLGFRWSSQGGNILTSPTDSTVTVDNQGLYALRVVDSQGCEDTDSVWVLLRSHPPVALPDDVYIVAGTNKVLPNNGSDYIALNNNAPSQRAYLESIDDTVFNVLENDYDLNGFTLYMSQIQTMPLHSTVLANDTAGNVTIMPDPDYRGVDSLEYLVCNTGIPEQCATAWLHIHALRPPKNADVTIAKSGDRIAFWGDSIHYYLSIFSYGPDTAQVISVDDVLDANYLSQPRYRTSSDDGLTWGPWANWRNTIDITDPLRPMVDEYRVQITAYVEPDAREEGAVVYNKAYISPAVNFIENNYENDTSIFMTLLREPVIARAGNDRILGTCQGDITLDGTRSSGENLLYSWTPTRYFDDPESPTPTFIPRETGIIELVLTVTDTVTYNGDLIILTDADTLLVNVLPPPVANAGADRPYRVGEPVALDGSKSLGQITSYRWTNSDGELVSSASFAVVDTTGYFYLTVTDRAGCSDIDSVLVYPFYYEPFAIPDYYSITMNQKIVSDDASLFRGLLYNDYDPNGMFGLTATPVTNRLTKEGGRVTIKADGQFEYTPPTNKTSIVDVFTYEVCNGTPDGCARGYVQITIDNKSKVANLSINKSPVEKEALIGKTRVLFTLEVTNNGPDDVTNAVVTDSLSPYIRNWRYSFSQSGSYSNWTGAITNLRLDAGQSRTIYLEGILTDDAPGRVFNAATITSPNFDPSFNWDSIDIRNVDTASVRANAGLLARAELVERNANDSDWEDDTIGLCDNDSYLRGDRSESSDGVIDRFVWGPANLLESPDQANTGFVFSEDFMGDTTIVFELIVLKGERPSVARVPVTISPRVDANAGPDRKKNEGAPIILDASASRGAGLSVEWWDGDRNYTSARQITTFDNGNQLRPMIYNPGTYYMYIRDKHGCEDIDTVTITENGVFALNDIMVVVVNDTVTGNVATNDYDPNPGDSIFYVANPLVGPMHGILLDNSGRKISAKGEYTYVPTPGFTGDDYFYYRIYDSNDPSLSDTGKVIIRVIDVVRPNSQPVANADIYFVNKNSSLELNVLSNDYDFEGGIVTLLPTSVSLPKRGTVSSVSDSSFSYVPNIDAVGADSFMYRIRDNGNPMAYDTAMVSVFIHKVPGENHKPVAVDDAYYVVEKSITGDLMLNDYDPDGNDLTLDIRQYVYATKYGVIEFVDQYSGRFTYTPSPGFEGTDQFVYTIKETGTIQKYSSKATVYFTCLSESRYSTDVSIVKTGPVEILSGSTIEYALKVKIEGPTLANDVVFSDTLSTAHIASTSNYSLDNGITWNTWTGSVTIPQMLLYEEQTILVRSTLVDTLSGVLPNIAKVSHDMTEIKPVNNTSRWETQVYQRVLANAGLDAVMGACVEEYQLDGSGSIGTGTLKYSWTPAQLLQGANTVDPTWTVEAGTVQQFILTVSSTYKDFSSTDTDTVWVRVAVSPVADAGDEFWDVVVPEITLDGSKSYGDGPITYQWWTTDRKGNVVNLDTTVMLTVDHSGKYYLTVTDTFNCSATDFTYVGYQVEPFIAVDDTVSTPQDDKVSIHVIDNDIVDKEDEIDLSTMVVSRDPSNGTVVWNSLDSTFVYTPDPYFVGVDTFYYIVTTINSYSDEAMVIINVLERPAFVPEGFSPNGDGINDVLRIRNIEKYPNNKFVIFNRWGNIVYKSDRYSNDNPWDGVANKGVRIGSGRVPSGVYLYVLDLGDDRIKERVLKGNIYVASGK